MYKRRVSFNPILQSLCWEADAKSRLLYWLLPQLVHTWSVYILSGTVRWIFHLLTPKIECANTSLLSKLHALHNLVPHVTCKKKCKLCSKQRRNSVQQTIMGSQVVCWRLTNTFSFVKVLVFRRYPFDLSHLSSMSSCWDSFMEQNGNIYIQREMMSDDSNTTPNGVFCC